MGKENLEAVRRASDSDPELAAALRAAQSVQDWVQVARDHGLAVEIDDVPPLDVVHEELSDAELAGVSGGYTFPQTDWIYCDNPWTNEYCTLKC